MKQKLFSHYDFIVIGDHPAALWGARLLLEKGLKVLIVPMGTGRERNFAPQFALEFLDLKEADFVNRELDPIQVLTPEKRFRVFSTYDALAEECEFVFGHKLNEFSALDVQLVRGLAYVYRGTETGPLPSEDWAAALQNLSQLVYFRKEAGWLEDQFLTQIRKLGGHVLEEGHLNRIFVEKKTFVGVQIEGSSTMITAARAWVASDWNLVQSLMSEALDVRSEPSAWIFQLKIKLSEDVIPVGLSSQMIWVQNGAPVIEIDQVKKGEFVLSTTMPYNESSLSRAEQRKISQRLFKVMAHIVPDLEYNLIRVYPDIRDPERTEQVDLVEQYPFHTLEQIPASQLRYSMPGLGTRTSVQGMGIAYDEAFPRYGEWGAYQAVQQLIQEWAKATQRLDLQKVNAPL